MKILKLTSPLPPSVNRYLKYRVAASGNKRYVQVYPSPETKEFNAFFEDYVKEEIKNQGWIKPKKGKLIHVKITFYLDRKRKDPNNFFKVPLDVLADAGAYYDDDVVLPSADRLYLDNKNPRLEIEIYESEAIGIFDNQSHLDKFIENNCSLCKRNVEKCGIMKKLLDNRIIEEVQNDECLKRRS